MRRCIQVATQNNRKSIKLRGIHKTNFQTFKVKVGRLSPKYVFTNLFDPSALPLGKYADKESEAVIDVLMDKGQQRD